MPTTYRHNGGIKRKRYICKRSVKRWDRTKLLEVVEKYMRAN